VRQAGLQSQAVSSLQAHAGSAVVASPRQAGGAARVIPQARGRQQVLSGSRSQAVRRPAGRCVQYGAGEVQVQAGKAAGGIGRQAEAGVLQ